MDKKIPDSRLSGGTSILTHINNDLSNPSEEDSKELANALARAAMQHQAEMAALGLQQTQAYLGDVVNARDNQFRTQESANASKLAKNVQAILAIGVIAITFILYLIVIYASTTNGFLHSQSKDIIIYILGALTTIATQVVSYYFGSSAGSADKSDTLNTIAKR